jgi:hypothetical protein
MVDRLYDDRHPDYGKNAGSSRANTEALNELVKICNYLNDLIDRNYYDSSYYKVRRYYMESNIKKLLDVINSFEDMWSE